MERPRNNLILLLFRELDEIHRIAGNADCQLRILLRVLLRIQQGIPVKTLTFR